VVLALSEELGLWQLNRAKQDFPQLRFLQTREQAPLTAASA